jgi:predicted DNA-binding transcriptional regulator YafY
MRASRLLQILLLLQNRGRLTCAALAKELEVTRRTILRDVDALTEAGLPIVVIRGNQGGIELGFNYRTRLTGLAADEAEALAVMLSCSAAVLNDLGIREAAARAAAKLVESYPDGVRERIEDTRKRFLFADLQNKNPDPRIAALAGAIRDNRIVRLRANRAEQRIVHPLGLRLDAQGWILLDARNSNSPIAIADWGDINISARRFG